MPLYRVEIKNLNDLAEDLCTMARKIATKDEPTQAELDVLPEITRILFQVDYRDQN